MKSNLLATKIYRLTQNLREKQAAEKITLSIPYSDDELESMRSRLKAKSFNPSAKFLDIASGMALGSAAGTLGATLGGNEDRWPVIAALGAGAGGLALGIKGPYSYLFRGAANYEKKELKELLSKLQADNTIPTDFTNEQIDNMRRLQDSWLQPKAHRDYWKKVLKAYDEQIGGK